MLRRQILAGAWGIIWAWNEACNDMAQEPPTLVEHSSSIELRHKSMSSTMKCSSLSTRCLIGCIAALSMQPTSSKAEPLIITKLKSLVTKTREKVHQPMDRIVQYSRSMAAPESRPAREPQRYYRENTEYGSVWEDPDSRRRRQQEEELWARQDRATLNARWHYYAPDATGMPPDDSRSNPRQFAARADQEEMRHVQPRTSSSYQGTGPLPHYLQPPQSAENFQTPPRSSQVLSNTDSNFQPQTQSQYDYNKAMQSAQSGLSAPAAAPKLLQPAPRTGQEVIPAPAAPPEISTTSAADSGSKLTSPPVVVAPKKPVDSDLPFGTPIPGKTGFVYSPFGASNGMVDVKGIPSGTKVECPYTGKTFRVP